MHAVAHQLGILQLHVFLIDYPHFRFLNYYSCSIQYERICTYRIAGNLAFFCLICNQPLIFELMFNKVSKPIIIIAQLQHCYSLSVKQYQTYHEHFTILELLATQQKVNDNFGVFAQHYCQCCIKLHHDCDDMYTIIMMKMCII